MVARTSSLRMAGAGSGCDSACPCGRGHAWRSRHLLLGAGSSGCCSSHREPQHVLPPAGKGLRSALTVWCPLPRKIQWPTKCHAVSVWLFPCQRIQHVYLSHWESVFVAPRGVRPHGRRAPYWGIPHAYQVCSQHTSRGAAPAPAELLEGAHGSPWVPLPSPNPPLYRTPSPATMPRPCAAPWITSHRRRRRRQWQKRLRRATSLRSASPKVRDQAEPGSPWRGGGRGEAVANQCLQCYSPRARLAQTKLQILLPLWVGIPMPSRILPQPPPGRG